jgi:PBP1b-binding outer membrane lipoprotein LpoB
MAYRRVLLVGDKISETKTELENMFSSKLFKINYTDLKTKIIASPVKNDTLVIDLNGDGADTVSKKVKDVGQKYKMKATIKTEKPMSKVNESKITTSALKEIIKTEIKKTIKEESMFKIDPNIAFNIYKILTKHYPEIGNDYTKSSFFNLLNKEL